MDGLTHLRSDEGTLHNGIIRSNLGLIQFQNP